MLAAICLVIPQCMCLSIRLPGRLTSYKWSIVTTRLSGTVTEIWPFEVLPGTLNGLFCADVPFRNYSLTHSSKNRCRLSVGSQYYTDLMYSSSLH